VVHIREFFFDLNTSVTSYLLTGRMSLKYGMGPVHDNPKTIWKQLSLHFHPHPLIGSLLSAVLIIYSKNNEVHTFTYGGTVLGN
jgi:hypothetical protein